MKATPPYSIQGASPAPSQSSSASSPIPIPSSRRHHHQSSDPIDIVSTSAGAAASSHSSARRRNGRGGERSFSDSDSYDDDDDDSSTSSSDDGGLRLGDDGNAALTVGSLPSHLRRSRRGAGAAAMAAARSLPPPRAPFLSSRKDDPGEKLSSMPLMTLPESAVDTAELSSSVPYGSLRESRFGRYRMSGRGQGGVGPRRPRNHNPRAGAGVHFAPNTGGIGAPSGLGDNAANGGAGGGGGGGIGGALAAAGGLATSLGSAGEEFYPQSLPAYMGDGRDAARRRWEERSAGASSGVAATADKAGVGGGGVREEARLASAGDTIGGGLGSRPKSTGGIGGLFASETQTSDPTAVSSLSSQLGGLTVSTASSGGGVGIGSALEAQTAGYSGNIAEGGLGGALSKEDGNNEIDQDEDKGGGESLLGTSLTVLEVLETTRQTPGGLGVKLTKQEMEGALESVHRAAQELSDSSIGAAAAPGREDVLNGINESPLGVVSDNDRPGSPHDPDTFGAFDLDLDD